MLTQIIKLQIWLFLANALATQAGPLPIKYDLKQSRRGFCNHTGIDHPPEIEPVKHLPMPRVDNPIEKEQRTNLFFSPKLRRFEHSIISTKAAVTAPITEKLGQRKGAKILLISATNVVALEPALGLATSSLESFGIPYDHVFLTENGAKRPYQLNYYEQDGTPKYYGIVITTNWLVYQQANGVFSSAFTGAEWAGLNAYQKQAKAKLVSLYTYPEKYLSVLPLTTTGATETNLLAFSAEEVKSPHLKGVKDNIQLELAATWYYGSKIANPSIVKPVLYYDADVFFQTSLKHTVAAAIIDRPESYKELHFFFSQSIFLRPSLVLANYWLNWLTDGVYLGKRRMFLQAQIDDVFLGTDLYHPQWGTDAPDRAYNYRITAEDIYVYQTWQREFMRPLVKYDGFTIDMTLNGNGIWEEIDYFRDNLFRTSLLNRNDFYWMTHTFTHADLNYESYEVTDWELKANWLVLDDIAQGDESAISRKSMVTPRISGMFNPNALKAMYDNGIRYLSGDNTREELQAGNIHLGRWMVKKFNGIEGILIIPRYATEVFYNVSLPVENAAEYNFVYRKHFGRDLSFEEILGRESVRVSYPLLKYEYAPHMFHQANLRSFPYPGGRGPEGRESLLSLWFTRVVQELRKFLDLPILTAKFDDLALEFVDRQKQKTCLQNGFILYQGETPIGMEISTDQDCPINFTVPAQKVVPGKIKVSAPMNEEKYGPDLTFRWQAQGKQKYQIKW